MIGKLLLVFLVAMPGYGISTMYHPTPQSPASPVQPSSEPEKTTQMWIYYSQMEAVQAYSLDCFSSGTGYWCPIAGVGGGHGLRV